MDLLLAFSLSLSFHLTETFLYIAFVPRMLFGAKRFLLGLHIHAAYESTMR